MSKRATGAQLRREADQDDARGEPIESKVLASADVMAKRKIAQPRSRVSSGVANPFASVGAAPAAAGKFAASSNPFASLSGSDTAAASATQAAKPAVNFPSVSAKPPQAARAPSKVAISFRALNERFAARVSEFSQSAAVEDDWAKLCSQYLSYAKSIETHGEGEPASGDVSMENEQESGSHDDGEKPDVGSSGPKLTSSGFSFGTIPTGPPTFTFGGKVNKGSQAAVASSDAPKGGFVFQAGGSGKIATLGEGNKDTTDQEKNENKEQESSAPKKELPKFSFGATSDPSPVKNGQPTFTFNKPTAADDKEKPAASPKFSFPTFTTGSSGKDDEKKDDSAAKPFVFSNPNASTPAFTFGAKPAGQPESAPKFSFEKPSTTATGSGSGSGLFNFSKPASDKPFTFGTGENPFSSSTTWTPGQQIKFDKPLASEPKKDDEAEAEAEAEDTPEEPQGPQQDLSGKGPGEEEEDTDYEKRAKVFQLADGKYDSLGLGNLRVLVHKESKKSRVLVRAEGSGRVILNVALRSQITYTVEGKNQVRIPDFSADGEKPAIYLVRVKTEADAQELKDTLDKVKS